MTKNNKEEKTQRKRAQTLIIEIAILALAFVFVVVLPRLIGEVDPVDGIAPAQAQDPIVHHPLTGLPIYEDVGTPRVYGVMIDNHVDAWPQTGLDRAFLVFEAPVEAGISRLLAFYSEDQKVDKIGPVRSARPYFLDWNNELDALYAHVGGSDAALDRIASGGTLDLNQYWFDQYFWRSLNRYAPHNVYTSTALLGSYPKKNEPLYETWIFKNPAVSVEPTVEQLNVSFYPPVYVANWKYDRSTNRYVRFQNGSAHTMEDGGQIFADNVAVMITDVKILDAVGRRSVRTIGEGEAMVFLDGKKQEGKWEKNSESQRLRFYTESGTEIALNSGVTWVEVIPDRDFLSF
jgi:hypothetical protein